MSTSEDSDVEERDDDDECDDLVHAVAKEYAARTLTRCKNDHRSPGLPSKARAVILSSTF
jgi:hypothetical protein